MILHEIPSYMTLLHQLQITSSEPVKLVHFQLIPLVSYLVFSLPTPSLACNKLS